MIQVTNISDLAPEERWKVPKEPQNLGGLEAEAQDDDAMDIDAKPQQTQQSNKPAQKQGGGKQQQQKKK
jgi:hypothetical protein